MPIRLLDENLWELRKPFAPAGYHIGLRMTVVRLGDSGLWVHSPVSLSDEERLELDRLGPVKLVVAPNKFHHIYLNRFRSLYPEAKYYGAPGLPAKRPDFPFTGELSEEKEAFPWSAELNTHFLQGMDRFNEVVFFHKDTRTLICTDLIFNLSAAPNLRTRIFSGLLGVRGRPAVSRLFRSLVNDKSAVKACLDRIQALPVNRIVMAHGEVVESDGRNVLAHALRERGLIA